MGLFDKKMPTSGGFGIRPLSHDRIAEILEKNEYSFGRNDDDGHPYCMFDGNPFRFHARGEKDEILMIRGWWAPEPPIELWNEFLQVCNDWESSRFFPKVYLEQAEGKILVVAELTIDLEHGVSDAQLDQFMACAIATSGQFFEHLNEKFEQYQSWMPAD